MRETAPASVCAASGSRWSDQRSGARLRLEPTQPQASPPQPGAMSPAGPRYQMIPSRMPAPPWRPALHRNASCGGGPGAGASPRSHSAYSSSRQLIRILCMGGQLSAPATWRGPRWSPDRRFSASAVSSGRGCGRDLPFVVLRIVNDIRRMKFNKI